ncbi:putative membrane protein [Nitrosospira briensis]|uniref:Putative membrane protein n=1 Tax=Nitrosospira briensis TaxID=35799 RepID=A0A1I5DQF1_9PROT|nr:putative membrane protein [Nitrosospira briensis]
MIGTIVDMSIGQLSELMLQHMVLMNLVVPGLIYMLRPKVSPTVSRNWHLATATQLALLWGWHSPPALGAAMSNPIMMLTMNASLTAAAAWFWLAIYATRATGRWRAIFALLVTGKLFCLLGALLVFAPRSLFGVMVRGLDVVPMSESLADQQLAGLVMLVVCPLIYITAGLVLASRWFLTMEAESRSDG